MHEVFGSERDYTNLAMNPNKADDVLNVRFYLRSVENKLKSWGGDVDEEVVNQDGSVGMIKKRIKGAGMPIFEPIEYVEIKGAGESKFTVIDAPANRNGYTHRFARQYAAFKRGETARAIGLPMSEWPGCNRADADNAAQRDIHTVEQAAAAPDGVIPNSLKQRAKDYLEAAKGQAPMTQMRAELASRDAEIAGMKAQMTALIEASARTEARQAQADAEPEAPKRIRNRKPASTPNP